MKIAHKITMCIHWGWGLVFGVGMVMIAVPIKSNGMFSGTDDTDGVDFNSGFKTCHSLVNGLDSSIPEFFFKTNQNNDN